MGFAKIHRLVPLWVLRLFESDFIFHCEYDRERRFGGASVDHG